MNKELITVILDNGHGSNATSNRSVDGRLYEWKFAREVVQGIKQQLESEGYNTFIVHPEDAEIGNQSKDLLIRTNRANQLHEKLTAQGKTSIYISVHVDAANSNRQWHKASGFTPFVYYHSSGRSQRLAQLLYEEAAKRGLKGDRSMPSCNYKTAGFWVLRKTAMPAVLTENLFMTNQHDVDFLLSEEGKQAVIDLHVEAIKRYIDSI